MSKSFGSHRRHRLVVEDGLDGDEELETEVEGMWDGDAANVYLPVGQVRELRDHLTKVLKDYEIRITGGQTND